MLKAGLVGLVIVCLGVAFFVWMRVPSEEGLTLTREQLKRSLDDPNVIIIDVRFGRDWTESDAKIKGAVPENPTMAGSWLNNYPKEKMIVFY